MIAGKTIDMLKVGDAAEFAKTVTETDIYLYARALPVISIQPTSMSNTPGILFQDAYRTRHIDRRIYFRHYR